MDRRALAVGFTTLAMLSACCAAQQTKAPPAPAKPGTPVAPPAGAKPAEKAPAPAAADRFKNVDELLDGLETADRDLSSLHAEIKYVRDSGRLEGAVRNERRGTIYYVSKLPGAAGAAPADPKGPARRGFAVKFNVNIVDGAVRQESREFVFDGEWLVESYPGEKQFFKRRMVPPGQVADPLRIGEGPFPIPIGQKRKDIQARFDTFLVDPLEGIDAANEPRVKEYVDRDQAYQLKLIPKAGTDEAREFKEIRIWYRSKDLLPRMARTVNRENGKAEVVLINHVRNESLDPKLFDTTEPKKEEGWQIEVDEYRKPVDEKP